MEKDIASAFIAVVGVSDDPRKYGHRIFRDLLARGGRVAGVNPRGGEVAGQKLRKTLGSLKPLPDLVITVVRPEVTERIVDECLELGIKEVWMQPGSESVAAIAKAEAGGMTVTHHACFMVRHGLW